MLSRRSRKVRSAASKASGEKSKFCVAWTIRASSSCTTFMRTTASSTWWRSCARVANFLIGSSRRRSQRRATTARRMRRLVVILSCRVRRVTTAKKRIVESPPAIEKKAWTTHAFHLRAFSFIREPCNSSAPWHLFCNTGPLGYAAVTIQG